MTIEHTIDKDHYRIDLFVTDEVYKCVESLKEAANPLLKSSEFYSLPDLLIASGLYGDFAHNLDGPALSCSINGKVYEKEYYIKGERIKTESKFKAMSHDIRFNSVIDDLLSED
jgi:hypothetical protein